jgi:hypothetical protein
MLHFTSAVCFVAVLAAVSLVSADCGHDHDIALQEGQRRDLAKPAPINIQGDGVENDQRALPGFGPIRIVFSTLDLDDNTKYCTTATGSVGDFKDSTIACSAETIFTAEKKAQLKNEVLPHAKKILGEALQVLTLTSTLKVGSTTQCDGGFTIPADHTTTGVAGADFVLYVGAAPTSGSTVAWAAGCQSDGASPRRLIVGRANFSPKYLLSSTFSKNLLLATGVHEILHAMGFSGSEFDTAGITSTITVRGISKKFVTGATARQIAREYIGCGSLPGVEIENEGGSGSAGSHTDRRIYKEDVMAATSGRALSVISLAVMKDLGVYDVNWSAAQAMIVGKDEGCGYTDDSEWCDKDTRNFCTAEGAIGCTSDLRGFGPCRTGSNAQFTDGCGYHAAYSNRQCDDPASSTNGAGNVFHKDSRCVITADGFTGSDTSSDPQRCLRSMCTAPGFIRFTLDGTNWAVCDESNPARKSGATIDAPNGVDGSIVCPNITRMCESLKEFANTTVGFGPLPPIEPVPTGRDNRAGDYVYTAKTELYITGRGWGNIVKNKYSELLLAITLDVAQYLKLEAQQVWLRSVETGETSILVTVTINDPTRTADEIHALWEEAIASGGRNWGPRTANLYTAHSGAGDTAILASASTAAPPNNLCAAYWMVLAEAGDTACGFAIFGLVVAVIGMIALIVFTTYKCCCQYVDPPTDWKYLTPHDPAAATGTAPK